MHCNGNDRSGPVAPQGIEIVTIPHKQGHRHIAPRHKIAALQALHTWALKMLFTGLCHPTLQGSSKSG